METKQLILCQHSSDSRMVNGDFSVFCCCWFCCPQNMCHLLIKHFQTHTQKHTHTHTHTHTHITQHKQKKVQLTNSRSLISSVQSFGHVRFLGTLWSAARQASMSIINFWGLFKLMSIELVMPFNHFILCFPLLLPSIFPSIRVFSSESILCIRWPKYWRFSFSISPSNEYSGLISVGWIGWISL